MPMAKDPNETQGNPTLTTAREPRKPPAKGEPGSLGDTAFKDAVIIVVAAWAVLVVLAYTLRNHNV